MEKKNTPSFNLIRIRQIRERKNLSQAFVANQLGISQSSYNDLEQGRTKLKVETLPLLAKCLSVEINCFFEKSNVTHTILNSQDLEKQYYYLLKENKNLTSLLQEQKHIHKTYQQRSEELIKIAQYNIQKKRFILRLLLFFNVGLLLIIVIRHL